MSGGDRYNWEAVSRSVGTTFFPGELKKWAVGGYPMSRAKREAVAAWLEDVAQGKHDLNSFIAKRVDGERTQCSACKDFKVRKPTERGTRVVYVDEHDRLWNGLRCPGCESIRQKMRPKRKPK